VVADVWNEIFGLLFGWDGERPLAHWLTVIDSVINSPLTFLIPLLAGNAERSPRAPSNPQAVSETETPFSPD